MRMHTLTRTLLASILSVTGCVAGDPVADPEQLAVDEAFATGVPAAPTVVAEFVGCAGTVADYLVTFASPGASRYDADYRRDAGAWASLWDGATGSARFATSNHTALVTFRARACNAAGCSGFDLSTPFRPRQCTGSGATP